MCCGEEDIFDFLKSLPTELEKIYELMLNKMRKKADLRSRAELRDGVKMFRFVLFARRPLTASELLHALGIPDNPDTKFTA